jgi:hypothetical protein
MIKSKPEKTHPEKTRADKSNDGHHQAAAAQSTQQIAKNAIRGGPKDVKKDVRMGVGRGQKG